MKTNAATTVLLMRSRMLGMADLKSSSILIIGCGTWGASTALHLARRGYKNVTVLDPYEVPSAISAGNDINKIVNSLYFPASMSPLTFPFRKAGPTTNPPAAAPTKPTSGTASPRKRPRPGKKTLYSSPSTMRQAMSSPPVRRNISAISTMRSNRRLRGDS